MSIREFFVNPQEKLEIIKILDNIKREIKEFRLEDVLKVSKRYSFDLPKRLVEFFVEFSDKEFSDAIVVKFGGISAVAEIGTPSFYVEESDGYVLNDLQVIHSVMAHLLGVPIGWSSQRKGAVINNIIATREMASVPNSSSGSAYDFGFHTEDAFHHLRGDYLGLVCLRNLEGATTRFFSVRSIKMEDRLRKILQSKRFIISNNPIHVLENIDFPPQSILYGSLDNPFMTVNFANMRGCDDEAQAAIDEFKLLAESAAEAVVLEEGDFFYLDNYYTAHARDSYVPRFDERSRWLSRFIITRDLRKSASDRLNYKSHVIQAK